MGFNLALLTGATSSAAGLMSFLPTMLLFAVLLYFMIYRPQKKRQQNAQNLLSSLAVGDKVQTIGGFIGEILVMEDDEFVILSEETKMRVKKNAVAIRVDPVTETVTESAPVVDDEDEDFKIDDFEI